MPGQIKNLYKVQKADVHRAGVVLADAFHSDAVWRLFFKDGATADQEGTFYPTHHQSSTMGINMRTRSMIR